MFPVPVPSIGAMQDVRAPTIQEARRGPSHRARSRRPGHSLRRTRNPHLLDEPSRYLEIAQGEEMRRLSRREDEGPIHGFPWHIYVDALIEVSPFS
jgi:hypothetical protein